MKKAYIVLPLAVLLMAGVMYGAVQLDFDRLRESAKAKVEAIDAERVELEKRFAELTAKHEPERKEIFDPAYRSFPAVIERYRARMPSTSDPTATPEMRHYRDAASGIIRRWEELDAAYKAAEAELSSRK